MDADAAEHGRPDVLDGTRLADAGGVVVDEVPLEIPYLLIVQDDLRELADPGVRPVHDLARLDLAVEHCAAVPDPIERGRVERDRLPVAGDPDDVLDLQAGSIDANWHGTSPGPPPRGRAPAALRPSSASER